MNLENLNIFNILIISGAIHGIIFSFILFLQKKQILKHTYFLALTVLFLSLSNLQYWLIDTLIVNSKITLLLTTIPWQWLIMPVFYLYVFNFVKQKKAKTKLKLLLVLPFLIVLSLNLILQINFNTNVSQKISIHAITNQIFNFLSIIYNVIIIIFTLKMIKSYEKSNIIVKSKVYPETLWLKRLLNIGLLICSVWLITIIFSILNENYKNQIFYPLWICISFLIYWIGYIGLAKSKLLIERKKLKANKKRETKIKKTINTNSTFNKIETKIITEQLYLNPNLNLSLLSNLLGLSEGYISQQINTNSEINFNDYINKLRINNAKETLTNKDFNNYTIESIGLESGFNSKSSFYAAFKKFTNQTPVQYKKDVRNL